MKEREKSFPSVVINCDVGINGNHFESAEKWRFIKKDYYIFERRFIKEGDENKWKIKN